MDQPKDISQCHFRLHDGLWHCEHTQFAVVGTGETVGDAYRTFLAAVRGVHPRSPQCPTS
ncbi:hypothetical protein KPA93_25000 [Burkholderia cenocepacia]|uniref:hypothetical protein n=1 Tax=Burkholderia TaxID=32008 RepID=UPI0018C36585|nr:MULTISPECIES: hypothetical protein [Burkholderia]MBG0871864.1 hypothetical protein [Burkholderia sp. 9777_1386]MDR8026483.1 hypothetical protein [Burkholderia cenocepacia]MDR8043737.1 hypothetical protein [Burkholderia cenocepacia]